MEKVESAVPGQSFYRLLESFHCPQKLLVKDAICFFSALVITTRWCNLRPVVNTFTLEWWEGKPESGRIPKERGQTPDSWYCWGSWSDCTWGRSYYFDFYLWEVRVHYSLKCFKSSSEQSILVPMTSRLNLIVHPMNRKKKKNLTDFTVGYKTLSRKSINLTLEEQWIIFLIIVECDVRNTLQWTNTCHLLEIQIPLTVIYLHLCYLVLVEWYQEGDWSGNTAVQSKFCCCKWP